MQIQCKHKKTLSTVRAANHCIRFFKGVVEPSALEILTRQSPEKPTVADPALSKMWNRTMHRSAFQPQPSQDSVIYFFQEMEIHIS